MKDKSNKDIHVKDVSDCKIKIVTGKVKVSCQDEIYRIPFGLAALALESMGYKKSLKDTKLGTF